ncbi:MAG: methyltransferase domain-containing protein [Dokdonella sp.]
MPITAIPVHCSAAWLRLARHEQQLLRTPDIPIAPTLWITADAQWRSQHVASPLLTVLHTHADELQGDVICSCSALPFERDSVQTIVVQHAADLMRDLRPLLGELCRILEPGGQLFWFGLNPLSGWAAWSRWRTTSTQQTLYTRGLRQIDQLLARHGVEATDSRYLGGLWPQSSAVNEARRITLIDGLRGAWLLSARKRRAVLTPLRATSSVRKIRAHGLAAMPSSRSHP